jgi:hypothetical protein
MPTFKNDSERLEFALTALRNIADIARQMQNTNTCPVADMAENTLRIIEKSQHEPAVDMNDLMLEIHEQM